MARINDSEFYMWRTLFAMAHADGVVSKEEIRFMSEVLVDIPFTPAQKNILTDDIKNAKDIVEMFEKISDQKHQARFFRFARDMVWADGEFGETEQAMLLKLKKAHIKTANVDDLVGKIDLEFLEEPPVQAAGSKSEPRNAKSLIASFRDQFFNNR